MSKLGRAILFLSAIYQYRRHIVYIEDLVEGIWSETFIFHVMKPTSSSSKRKFSAETLFDNKVLSDTKEEVPLNSSYLIAIVGGGIAGLGAALALQQRGFRVKVYERDLLFEDRRQGYGLTLTNNPKGPLAELDLLDECITRDCPSNAHWIFAPQGNVLGYYGRSFKNVGEAEQIINGVETSDTPHGKASKRPKLSNSLVEGRGNLRIPRQNLRRMMLEKLNPGTVSWGMKLVDYVEDLDGVRAQFQSSKAPICENKNGIINTTDNIATTEILDLNQENSNNIVEIYADVLVGADGIRSIVRQLRGKKLGVQSNSKPIVESSPLHYVGVAVILGITTATHPLINQQVSFFWIDQSIQNHLQH